MTEYIFGVIERVIWDKINNLTQEKTNSEVYYDLGGMGFRSTWSVTSGSSITGSIEFVDNI